MSNFIMSLKSAAAKISSPEKLSNYFLLLIGFTIGAFLILSVPIKLDEPLILDYFYFNIIQPDHYSLFYLIVKPFMSLFGDSNASIRTLPFIFFLLSIHIFYKYLIFVFSSYRLAFLGVLLILSNSFFLNISIYAYEYSLFFLLTLSSIFLFDKYLISGKGLLWLLVINILGLSVFTMFYHIIISQILMLLIYRKLSETKQFIAGMLAAIFLHFGLITTRLLHFRFGSENQATAFDRTLIDFVGDLAGLDIYSLLSLQKTLIITSFVLLVVFILSLLVNFNKNRMTGNRFVYFLILFAVSAFTLGLFKFLKMREIEFRYYFYLIPVFIASVLQLKKYFSKKYFFYILTLLISINLVGAGLFLKYVKYGENTDLMHKLFFYNQRNSPINIYTNNLWNYQHLILPVYFRQFKNTPDNLHFSETSDFLKIPDQHFLVLQFQPENIQQEQLPRLQTVVNYDQFFCARCDSDKIKLYEYKIE